MAAGQFETVVEPRGGSRRAPGPRRRRGGVESEEIHIFLDADVKRYADVAAQEEGVTTALWLQELIRREQLTRGGVAVM